MKFTINFIIKLHRNNVQISSNHEFSICVWQTFTGNLKWFQFTQIIFWFTCKLHYTRNKLQAFANNCFRRNEKLKWNRTRVCESECVRVPSWNKSVWIILHQMWFQWMIVYTVLAHIWIFEAVNRLSKDTREGGDIRDSSGEHMADQPHGTQAWYLPIN